MSCGKSGSRIVEIRDGFNFDKVRSGVKEVRIDVGEISTPRSTALTGTFKLQVFNKNSYLEYEENTYQLKTLYSK